MRFYFSRVLVVITLFLLAVRAWASINGSISGIVTDPSGGVVGGAQVVAIETQTHVRTEVATDAKGFFNFPTLPIGNYTVEIQAKGFKTYRQGGLVVDANSALRVDATLQLGQATEEVSVTSDAAQVETQSTQMGEVISGTRMTTVPLNGRAYTDLLSLQPGVVPSAYGSTAPGLNDRSPSGAPPSAGGSGLNSGNQSVNGQREAANGFMVNGSNVTEGKNNGTAIIPNLDSISEFRIITNNFDAEYGNFSGGQVNVATKSGTNAIHGTAFEFVRNTALNARNFFNPAPGVKGAFSQNQFGGTVGGPLKKDKIFIFMDYQGTQLTQSQTQSTTLPSAADRTGDLTDLAGALSSAYASSQQAGGSPAGTVQGAQMAANLSAALGYTVTTGEPYYYGIGANPNNMANACTSGTGTNPCVFPNAQIPMSAVQQLSPPAAALLQGPFIPQGDPVTGAFTTSAFANTLNDNKGGVRVDANTHLGSFFAYYFIDNYSENDAYPNGGATVPGYNGLSLGRAQLVNLGFTKTINATSVNEFHFSYTRNAANLFTPQGGLGHTLTSLGFTAANCPANASQNGCQFNGGILATSPTLEGVPNVVFNDYTIGVPADTVGQFNNTFQWQDVFSKVFGAHSLRFGGQYHYDQINERNYYGENGQYTFNGNETGVDFADFLIGAPVSFIQASHQVLDSRSQYLGLFIQDSWRVKPSFTFNYGLRYEISLPWYDTQNKIETIIPGEQSIVFPTAPTGWLVPGDPGVPRTLAPPKYNAFSPRLGIAYSPNATSGFLAKLTGGPGKTSIRVGFGLYYTSVEDLSQFLEVGDPPYGIFWVSSAPPFFATPFLSRQDNSVETASGTNPFPFVFPPTNVSAKNPDSSFPWQNVEPISSGFVFWHKNRMPYSEHYELSVQRQFGANTVVSASYVGDQGHKLITSIEANPGSASICNQVNQLVGSGTCAPFGENTQYTLPAGTPAIPGAFYVPGTNTITGTRTVLNPTFFGSNPYMKEISNSAYNSFQTSIRYSSARGEFLFGYTFSKCLDNSSGLQDTTNPFDTRLSRSLCSFNVTQNFVASYDVNFQLEKLFHADHGFANKISAGWSLSGITTFATGLPITLSENDDNSLTGAVGVDVPQLSGVGSLFMNKNPRAGQPYFNPGYFTTETLGQIGNANRRFFSGPGLNNWDIALLKNTNLTESKVLQLRFETFNTWNHAQFMNPTGVINSSLFGVVNSARSARVMQMGAKFLF